MLAPTLVATLIGLLIFTTFRVRHRESRRDSITRFADARKAMSISQGLPAVRLPDVVPHDAGNGTEPASVVVQSGSATLLDPLARRQTAESRRSFRRDPEVLARRPTVAMLPTLLGSHGAAGAGSAARSGEPDSTPPVMPQSEAS